VGFSTVVAIGGDASKRKISGGGAMFGGVIYTRLEASPPIATTVLKPTAKARPPYINPLTIPQNTLWYRHTILNNYGNTYCRLLLIRR
jgi:uncharacterized membrane protein YkvI